MNYIMRFQELSRKPLVVVGFGAVSVSAVLLYLARIYRHLLAGMKPGDMLHDAAYYFGNAKALYNFDFSSLIWFNGMLYPLFHLPFMHLPEVQAFAHTRAFTFCFSLFIIFLTVRIRFGSWLLAIIAMFWISRFLGFLAYSPWYLLYYALSCVLVFTIGPRRMFAAVALALIIAQLRSEFILVAVALLGFTILEKRKVDGTVLAMLAMFGAWIGVYLFTSAGYSQSKVALTQHMCFSAYGLKILKLNPLIPGGEAACDQLTRYPEMKSLAELIGANTGLAMKHWLRNILIFPGSLLFAFLGFNHIALVHNHVALYFVSLLIYGLIAWNGKFLWRWLRENFLESRLVVAYLALAVPYVFIYPKFDYVLVAFPIFFLGLVRGVAFLNGLVRVNRID